MGSTLLCLVAFRLKNQLFALPKQNPILNEQEWNMIAKMLNESLKKKKKKKSRGTQVLF